MGDSGYRPAAPSKVRSPRIRLIAGRTALAVLIPALSFLVLEAVLRARGVVPAATADPYLGFDSVRPLFLERTDDSGAVVLETAPYKLAYFNRQRFPKQKPAGSIRIFTLGGSTTYGRPYDDATSFSGWLREILPRVDPGHTWEVINAGGISYASYRVALLMEELTAYQPDLFIVYTGHNEFLERRTYRAMRRWPRPLLNLGAMASQTRTFAWLRRLLTSREDRAADPLSVRELMPAEVDAVLDHSVGPEAYQRDDVLQEKVTRHFESSLQRMAQIARQVGAQIVFVVPADNLRDCSPFRSEHRAGLATEQLQRFDTGLQGIRAALNRGDAAVALRSTQLLLDLDARHADALFLRGRSLWALGRYREAEDAFTRSRDEDVCALRATTGIQEAVRRVGGLRGTAVVDFPRLCAASAPEGIPGHDVFLDHVHPTVAMHGRLAVALTEALARIGIVRAPPDWESAIMSPVAAVIEGRIDPAAQATALRNLAKVLGWAGKFEEADRLTEQAAALSPNDPDAQETLGVVRLRQRRLDDARAAFDKAIQLDPQMARAHYGLALVCYWQQDWQGAEQALRRTLTLEPASLDAHRRLVDLLVQQGRPEDAAAACESALARFPQEMELRHAFGLVLSDLGRFEDAAYQFEDALRLDPSCVQAHYNLGNMCVRQGRHREAAAHYRRAVELKPDYPEAFKNMGGAYAAQGMLPEALSAFEKAARLKPNDASVQTNLSLIRAALRAGPKPASATP